MSGRVVLYRRVSALMGRGGDDFHSPEMQTAAMRKHVDALGLRVVGEHEDIDVSGRTFVREGLDRVRAVVEAGGCDAVAVYDVSRLGRNTSESLAFIKWLQGKRVEFISTRERIDDTPEGRLALTLWLAMAELQSDRIGKQWSEVIHRRAHQGKQHGKPPIGYRRGPNGWEVDPIVGPAVAEAFRRYAAGDPLARITDEMATVRGVPTHRQVVKRMLANPIYVGKATLWGASPQRNHTWKNQPKHVVQGAHPAIIDVATYEACAARQVRDSTAPARTLRPSHALVRAVFCAECGAAAVATASSAAHGSVRKYRCGRQDRTKACTGCGSLRVDQVEATVLAAIADYVRLLKGPVDAKRQEIVRQRTPRENADKLAEEMEQVRASMTRLVDRWVSGAVPDHSYEALMAQYRQREEQLSQRHAESVAAAPTLDAHQLVAIGERLVALWGEMTPWERNEGVRLVGAQVVLRRSRWLREPVAERVEVTFPGP